MKKLLLLISLFTINVVVSGYVQIDEKDTPSIIKSSYLYNFAKMVDWSESIYAIDGLCTKEAGMCGYENRFCPGV